MSLDAWGDWEADPQRIHVPVTVDPARVNRLRGQDVLLLVAPVVVMATGWAVSLFSHFLTGA